MENLFILFGLSFDPPESDTKKIEDAIAKKRAQWAKDVINPLKKAKAGEYMENIDKMKEILMNPSTRNEEALKAKRIKAEKLTSLKEKISLLQLKGNAELSEKELAQLIRQFGPFGYTEQEIKKYFSQSPKPKTEIDPSKVLEKTYARNVENLLQQLDMRGHTLYEFLNLPPTASAAQLCEAADAMKKKLLAKGEKTARDAAAQTLCGLCVTIFKDAEGKRKYDNYVNLTKFIEVNDAINELALGNGKRIEPKMKEGLIDLAVKKYHVTVSDASDYINNYCNYAGYALPESKIICGLCGAENAAGATHCSKCGKPLFIVCPSCGTQNNNSAKACAKCGFDLTQMDKAVDLLRQAKQKYAAKAFEEAEQLLKQAKAFWPNHEDIVSLEKTISEERKKLSDAVAAIMKDVQEKRLYAAQTKIDQVRANGFKVDEAIAGRVAATLKGVEKQLAEMRENVGDAAFKIAWHLSSEISDCEELNRSLKNFPPMECSGLAARSAGREVTFTWKASDSIGEVRYRLVRKENVHPNGPEDGVIVYDGVEQSCTDGSMKKSTAYFYSVYAVRLGVFSRACRLEEAVVVVDAVENLRATGGDQMVTLSWDKAADVTEIRVWKFTGREHPAADDTGERIDCARLDGLTVSGLKNGNGYWFAVSAGHTLAGNTYYSDMVYVSAVPQKPAKPLQNFHASLSDDVFQASWEKSEWDVILFHSRQEPEYAVGTIYDLSQLLQKYEKIDLNLKNATQAEFHLNFTGECYILPGVINASNVILNKPVYISSVPCVRDVSYDLNSSATEMYVNFTWPKRIDRSALLYRMDTYPTGIEDPLANRIDCSKRQYEANEGILILNPAKGTFYAEIYTYFESGDRCIYSDGVRALFSNEPQREVMYTIRYKKGGMFSKSCRLSVTVEGPGRFVFPAFVIVSKLKSVPLKRGDGNVVCSVEESVEIDGSRTFEYTVPPIQSGTRLKMFFLNDKNYSAFKIACKREIPFDGGEKHGSKIFMSALL